MFGIGGYEPIFFQIALAFLHEFLMRRIRAYTWAKRLGQMEAFGIGHVPPEKRPCPANIGPVSYTHLTLPTTSIV